MVMSVAPSASARPPYIASHPRTFLAEFPCPFEKIPVTEALAGPVGKALDRLGGGGGIQPAVGPPGPRTAVSVALTV